MAPPEHCEPAVTTEKPLKVAPPALDKPLADTEGVAMKLGVAGINNPWAADLATTVPHHFDKAFPLDRMPLAEYFTVL